MIADLLLSVIQRCSTILLAHILIFSSSQIISCPTRSGSECQWQLTVTSNTTCNNTYSGICEVPQYFSSITGQPLFSSEAPPQLQNSKFQEKSGSAEYDIYHYTNDGGCRDFPGPASKDVYCVKTTSPTWLAFRWYRFIDQPPLQRAKLTSAERNYLQSRIENLHRANPSQWLKPGPAVLNAGRAAIDEGLVVTPPAGMEIGYVPISLWEGYSQPSFCDHVL